MSMSISEEEVSRFHEDGSVCLRGVIPKEWVEKLRDGIEFNFDHPGEYAEYLSDKPTLPSEGKSTTGLFFDDYCNWENIPHFQEFIFKSGIGELVAKLLRSDQVAFYHEHVMIKRPQTLKKTPWHHDQSYYPAEGGMLSLWIPVDDVPPESTLCFIKGSHKWGKWLIPRKFETSNNYQVKDGVVVNNTESGFIHNGKEYVNIPDDLKEGDTTNYTVLRDGVRPGDCLAFWGTTVHGADGNAQLQTSRRVLALRFFGDSATFTDRPWTTSPPITGGLTVGDKMTCAKFPQVFPYQPRA